MTEPQTRDELRDAAEAAQILLGLAVAPHYGLIDEHGQPNLERCEDIVTKAMQVGIFNDDGEPSDRIHVDKPIYINVNLPKRPP